MIGFRIGGRDVVEVKEHRIDLKQLEEEARRYREEYERLLELKKKLEERRWL